MTISTLLPSSLDNNQMSLDGAFSLLEVVSILEHINSVELGYVNKTSSSPLTFSIQHVSSLWSSLSYYIFYQQKSTSCGGLQKSLLPGAKLFYGWDWRKLCSNITGWFATECFLFVCVPVLCLQVSLDS